MKTCKKCKCIKDVSEFGLSSRQPDKLDPRCKICVREKHLKYRSENTDKCRTSDLMSRYGITIEDYRRMYDEQDGKCAICNKIETLSDRKGIRSLSVDHCHKTKQIRGLLCGKCNRGIGNLDDDPEILLKASQYVAKFKL